MVRVADYEVRVVDLAEKLRGSAFVWGSTDCASVARRVLVAMLATDPWRKLVRPYDSLRTALSTFQDVDLTTIWWESGGCEVVDRPLWTGDVGMGPGQDSDALPSLYVALPRSLALAATRTRGVFVAHQSQLAQGTRWYRYG